MGESVLLCDCQVCGLSFRVAASEAEKHVFRTDRGRLMVLCPLHLEQARFDRYARKMLLEGKVAVEPCNPRRMNPWGYE